MSSLSYQDVYGRNATEPVSSDDFVALFESDPEGAPERFLLTNEDFEGATDPTIVAAYNPSQARIPKNNPTGGEWLDTPSGILREATASGVVGHRSGSNPVDWEELDDNKDALELDRQDAHAEVEAVRQAGYDPTMNPRTMTPEQRSVWANDGYTGPLDYPAIQSGLRTGDWKGNPKAPHIARVLTGPPGSGRGPLVGRITVEKDTMLHQTVRAKRGGYDPRTWRAGDLIGNAGFTSTSTSRDDVAKFRNVFNKNENWVFIDIHVPAGTKGFAGLDKFHEIVLDPGAIYQVLDPAPDGTIRLQKVE